MPYMGGLSSLDSNGLTKPLDVWSLSNDCQYDKMKRHGHLQKSDRLFIAKWYRGDETENDYYLAPGKGFG